MRESCVTGDVCGVVYNTVGRHSNAAPVVINHPRLSVTVRR